MFATDGVYSTKPLDVYAPKKKTLGAWEEGHRRGGRGICSGGRISLAIQAIKDSYANSDDEKAHFKVKTRGFSPKEIDRAEGKSFNQAVSEVLGRDIPQYWARGEKTYEFHV